MPSDGETALPREAQQAWFAYRAMCESKRNYFTLLSDLEQKYKDTDESPSEEESARLSELLKYHDENVKAFNEAMSAITEPASRQALLVKLQADKS